MSLMKIGPVSYLRGEVVLPGDKSVSHRSAILASMANGATSIENFSASADCASTLECLRSLGVEIERDDSHVSVNGVGKTGFARPAAPLDCGNSGTTMRLLSGVLAGQGFDSILTGDDSLRKRPMRRVITPLSSMGAIIDAADGVAPLFIRGQNPLRSATIVPEVASAQIKSAVLLAGLNSDGITSIIESTATRDHTERMMRWLGADVRDEVSETGKKVSVSGDAVLIARDIVVPSDISAAVFFMVAAACLSGSEVLMKGVGVNGSRRAIVDVLRGFGADIEITDQREVCNEPVADIRVTGGLRQPRVRSNRIEGATIAGIIDEIPALAVFGTQLEGGIEVRDAGELRVKESDRITTVVENLQRMGADVEEFADGFAVRRSALKGATVYPAGDHRIAMAFAVAGLFAEGVTEIEEAECCDVSFPGFFEALDGVSRRETRG
jgi:3-phosphoshikimate 1-carboxyvinyltransferase